MADAQDDILEPDLPIVDPHHHAWDRAYPTTHIDHPFSQIGALRPRFLIDELLADFDSGHNVLATVYVECMAMYRQDGPEAFRPLGETEFANGIAAMSASGIYGKTRLIHGIVGHASLLLGDGAQAVLEAQIAAAGGRFRGIRHAAAWDADDAVLGPVAGLLPRGLYMDKTFREGFAKLAPLGLSFDAWLFEPQLPELIDLARAFPETQIVLDHAGTPLGIGAYTGRRDERFGVWRDGIRTLAACPNMSVKVGGLGMPFAGFPSLLANPRVPETQLVDEWRPYVETCIEAFGATRSMFESNYPPTWSLAATGRSGTSSSASPPVAQPTKSTTSSRVRRRRSIVLRSRDSSCVGQTARRDRSRIEEALRRIEPLVHGPRKSMAQTPKLLPQTS